VFCHPRFAFIRRLQLSTHNSQLRALACQPSNPASSTPCHSLEVGAILLLTILVAFSVMQNDSVLVAFSSIHDEYNNLSTSRLSVSDFSPDS
jgi:hypothetical protein